MGPTQPFTQFTREITITEASTAKIRFKFFGSDSRGALLDDVSFRRIDPEVVLASPVGDFSNLVKNADGTFSRRLTDGTVISFDDQGRQTAVTDPNGNATRYLYDAQGRLAKTVDPSNALADPPCATAGVTCFAYNAQGLLASTVGPAGRTTLFTYDAEGNRTGVTQADSTTIAYTYDSQHRLTATTDERSFTTTHAYGFAGQFTGSGFPDGASVAASISKSLGLADLGIGLGSEANPAPFGRPENQMASVTDANGNVTTIKLDEFGAPSEITDAVGRTTVLERDDDSLVTLVTAASDGELPGGSVPGQVVTELDYDTGGNVTAQREAVGRPWSARPPSSTSLSSTEPSSSPTPGRIPRPSPTPSPPARSGRPTRSMRPAASPTSPTTT